MENFTLQILLPQMYLLAGLKLDFKKNLPAKYWSGARRQKVPRLFLLLLFERSIGSLGKRRDWS